MATFSSPAVVRRPALEVRELSRRFGGLVAVDQVSFALQPGEIFGLIGPNGAGKTTLFNVISGFIPPSSGAVIYNGKKITRMPAHKIARQGMARTFQNIRLFGNLSALQNVLIARHIHTRSGLWSGILGLRAAEEQAARQHALELLELVGLADRAHLKANTFAYGDQRRIEIARAMALEPSLLLLDEPAAGMNTAEKHELSNFINELRRTFDLSILLIEHHVPLVMGLCDRIAVLHFGRLIALGHPAEVKTDLSVIAAYLGDEA